MKKFALPIIITLLLLALFFGGFFFYKTQSIFASEIQNPTEWQKIIDKEGSISLTGRINQDHTSKETKLSKLKEYANNNIDLFTAIFTVPEEKRELPVMYREEIENIQEKMKNYSFSKNTSFSKTNNLVTITVENSKELQELVNSNIFFDLEETAFANVETGPSAFDVQVGSAWLRERSDVSFPDRGEKQLGTDQLIAIIDMGVENTHPYLKDKVTFEACFQDNYTSREDCADGETGTNTARPCPADNCSHGTFMAGIAAGNGDRLKLTNSGIAKQANIYAIQVFGERDTNCRVITDKFCYQTSVKEYSQALDFVHIYNMVRKFYNQLPTTTVPIPQMSAVNMSFGGGVFNAFCDSNGSLFDVGVDIAELKYTYNVPTVISAGNGIGSTGIGGSGVGAPGCLREAVTVSATANNTTPVNLTGFSNAANTLTDISAPGDLTFSSLLGNSYTPDTGSLGGTSGAAAHVSGAFALLNEVFPNDVLTVDNKLKLLTEVGTPFNYFTFSGVMANPNPLSPNPFIGTGPVAGNSVRLRLCQDYERTGTGEAGDDAPFNVGTWRCKGFPEFTPPPAPSSRSPFDWLKPQKIQCKYCRLNR
jgi:subtilisin family serine protease